MGNKGILTQCVQREDYSSQAKPLKKPECAEHGHVHWECHSQSKYQNEYDWEEQYRPSTNPKNKYGETVLKASTDIMLDHYNWQREGQVMQSLPNIAILVLMLVPFFSFYYCLLKPRFLSQLCIDKFTSDRIKQRQHIVLLPDLTIIFKTPQTNKEEHQGTTVKP